MKISKFRVISNLIIICMFIILISYIGTSNYKYVFSYNNNDVIYNGNRESNKVSIMFNVYWGTEYIEDILEVLDKYDVKTTFFVGGSWVEKESEIFKKMCSYGHEIGNHGYLHKEHEYLDYDNNYQEIHATHNLVKVYSDIDMNLFAPPSGSFNKSTLKSASDLGYKTIMWSKDTIDWKDHDANLIFKRATNNIIGGDLILVHPTEHTLKALPLILEYYKVNNLYVTTVSDCLK